MVGTAQERLCLPCAPSSAIYAFRLIRLVLKPATIAFAANTSLECAHARPESGFIGASRQRPAPCQYPSMRAASQAMNIRSQPVISPLR
jgi:hypothetical protein